MILNAFVPDTTPMLLGGKPITIKPITIRGTMRLAKLLDNVKGELGMTYGDFSSMDLSGAGIAKLVTKVFETCVAGIDLDHPQLTGTPLTVFTELAALVGVTVDDLLDANVDDLFAVCLKFWDVNGSGPLGQRIRAIIASLKPTLTTAKDLMAINFRRALITGLPVGGTPAGGTTASSSPSTSDLDGTNQPSSTDSPHDVFSVSSPH